MLVGVELPLGAARTGKIASVESYGVRFDVYCMYGALHDRDNVRVGRHDLALRIADGRRSLARKR